MRVLAATQQRSVLTAEPKAEGGTRRANRSSGLCGNRGSLVSFSADCICSVVMTGELSRARLNVGVRKQLPGNAVFKSVPTSWQETLMVCHFLC